MQKFRLIFRFLDVVGKGNDLVRRWQKVFFGWVFFFFVLSDVVVVSLGNREGRKQFCQWQVLVCQQEDILMGWFFRFLFWSFWDLEIIFLFGVRFIIVLIGVNLSYIYFLSLQEAYRFFCSNREMERALVRVKIDVLGLVFFSDFLLFLKLNSNFLFRVQSFVSFFSFVVCFFCLFIQVVGIQLQFLSVFFRCWGFRLE